MYSHENWITHWFHGYAKAAWRDGLVMRGTREFRDDTFRALELLENAGHADAVARGLTLISQGLRSTGYIEMSGSSTYVVGEFTWRLGLVGYASMIAHHARRSVLYEDVTEPAFSDAEVQCVIYQMDVLNDLHASDQEYDSAIGLAMSEAREIFTEKDILRRRQATSDGVSSNWLRRFLPSTWFFSRVDHLGVQIRGSTSFIMKCQSALDLLADLDEWEVIRINLGVIQESKHRTHIRVSLQRPLVNVLWILWSDKTDKELAGIIAHEAFHNHVFRETQGRKAKFSFDDPTGKQEERACTDFQINVLEKLGDCSNEIKGLEYLTMYPAHFGSWDNAFDRKWSRSRTGTW